MKKILRAVIWDQFCTLVFSSKDQYFLRKTLTLKFEQLFVKILKNVYCLYFVRCQYATKSKFCSRNVNLSVCVCNVYTRRKLTNKKPDVRFSIQLVFVNLTEDSSRGHDVEEADYDPRVLSAEIAHCIAWIRQKRLSGYYLYARLLTVCFQIFDGLQKR